MNKSKDHGRTATIKKVTKHSKINDKELSGRYKNIHSTKNKIAMEEESKRAQKNP
jgi:hypothetical protein